MRKWTEREIEEVLEKVKSGKIWCICQIPTGFPLSWWEIFEETGISLEGHFNSAGGYCCPHYGNTCGDHPEYDEEWEEE